MEFVRFLGASELEPSHGYLCKASAQGFVWDSTTNPVAFGVTEVSSLFSLSLFDSLPTHHQCSNLIWAFPKRFHVLSSAVALFTLASGRLRECDFPP